MKLKPITIVNARYPRYGQNTTQQLFLLKALKITQNPDELRKMIGVKKVADVFRTLDKLSLRKEFHKALVKSGIDFEYIVGGLKTEAETAIKSADRIKVYQTLLKSLGMDSYDDASEGGGKWEEDLIKKIEEDKQKQKLLEEPNGEYYVNMPEVPESVKRKKEAEKELGKSIYG